MFRKDTKFGASAALIALVGGDFNVRILLLWFIATEGTEMHRKILQWLSVFSPKESFGQWQ